MAIASPSGPLGLTFPPSTFAKLSPHPYLLAHLSPSTFTDPTIRPNGRLPSEFRTPQVNTGSLTHTEGSAVVRLGDTTAVCGIRGEILLASDIPGHRVGPTSRSTGISADGAKELQDPDLLVPNIELATGCSPAFLPGQPPSILAQSLSTRVYSLLRSSRIVDINDLRIWYTPPAEADGNEMIDDDDGRYGGQEAGEEKAVVKAYWTLYIDVLFISFEGNPFDVAWAAIIAALRNVRLPRAYWDVDSEMVLCSDEYSESKTLSLKGLPVASTFVVFMAKEAQAGNDGEGKARRQWILADPDAFEEGLCDESATVVVDCSRAVKEPEDRSHVDVKDDSDTAMGLDIQRRVMEKETRLLCISKAGGTRIGRVEMRELVSIAEKRWLEWQGILGSGLEGKT